MILVTGASGFLGLQLLHLLTTGTTPIRAVYHNTPPQWQHPLVQWVKANLLDVEEVTEIFKEVQWVYHCAAIVSFDAKHKAAIVQQNVAVTANIINEALDRNIKKLVHVSSIAAMGKASLNNKIDENTFWTESKENSAYSKSKYYAEMEVWRGMAEGLNAAIVNPGIILGEGNYAKGSAQLMSNVAKEFPYYTLGVNAWVDVIDVAKAMILLMHSNISEERYILSEDNYSYQEIFNLMAHSLQVKAPQKEATPFMAELVWRIDTLKATITGSNPLITKESARTAQAKNYYNNQKFLNAFPDFQYTPIAATIERMALDFKKK